MAVVLEAQRRFFAGGGTRSVERRRDRLRRLRDAVERHADQLLAALHEDMRKPPLEAWTSELQLVLDEASFALRRVARWAAPRRVPTSWLHLPASSRIEPEPLGTVLILGPWNYPVQLLLAPLVGALAAGNTAVLKPSEVAPHSSAACAALIRKTFAEEEVAVFEGGAETAQALLEHRFDHLFFTGGRTVGRLVMAAAARHLTPVTLELGGKSPCLVDRTVDPARAARRIAWGKFFNAGQTCVAPDYVLVHRALRVRLVDELRAAVREFYGPEPRRSPDFARIINDRHVARLAALIPERVACGGEVVREERYVAPTVIDGVGWDDPLMADEIFGPLLPVLEFDDAAEAIRRVSSLPRPLALYVFSSDDRFVERALAGIPSGGACVNDTIRHITTPHLPLGGVGASGFGRYRGQAGFETFSHLRSVMRRGWSFDPGLVFPPYRVPLRRLRSLLRWTS
ncbi:MAG: aldehyde dehydrogenase family protein [Myxococcales bacterium]|nr:aldehyde dehydrogenase family protein [Myxococcales bacterium]